MTPEDIVRVFQSGTAAAPAETDRPGGLSEDERARRVAQLAPILDAVSALRGEGAGQLDLLAQKIGDASRDEQWRVPLGEAGLLDFFAHLLDSSALTQPLLVHTLRIIGNCCADTDENRERVLASGRLPKIVPLLGQDPLLDFAIPVLFNICVDYEPTQKALYQAGLNPALVDTIVSERLSGKPALISYACRLLSLLADQEPEAQFVHPDTAVTLLKLATGPDSDDDAEEFVGSASVAITYLSHAQFQESFLESPGSIPLFLGALEKICVGFDPAGLDKDDEEQLKKLYSVFIQALSDLSASPTFSKLYPLDGPAGQTLQNWVSSSHPLLQGAAYIALGNLARSDDVCLHLVQSVAIHKPLIEALRDESQKDAQLLHAALGFLKNLAIPAANKPVLGGAGLLDNNVLPRLWGLQLQPQVQFAAISLTRLLLGSCTENVRRICAIETSEDESAAPPGTRLSRVINTLRESDQEPTKMEAARTVLAVCRALHSESSHMVLESDYQTDPAGSALQKFYGGHGQLASALVLLGSQSKFPALRSELWFVLALMARSEEGAAVVAELTTHNDLVGPLLQVTTGKNLLEGHVMEESNTDQVINSHSAGLAEESLPEPQQVDPKQAASISKADRENGLVLISELTRRVPDKISPGPREIFHQLLKNGGVLADETQGSRP